MEKLKIIVPCDDFIQNFEDFVLVYALDAARYNFMEVVRNLRIEEEVELFFGKTLDKYTAIDQFEFIIQDIVTGTPPEKYEELLIKMHKSFVFPDHLLIVNPAKLEEKKLKIMQDIISEKLLCNHHYWKKGPGKPDSLEQISVTVNDFSKGVNGLYCFVLLHKDDYSSLGQDDISRIFKTATPLNL